MKTATLLTAKEVADRLTIGVRTVWRWAKSGELPAPVRMGHHRRIVRWRADEIDAWLALEVERHPMGQIAAAAKTVAEELAEEFAEPGGATDDPDDDQVHDAAGGANAPGGKPPRYTDVVAMRRQHFLAKVANGKR